ncbi:MAG: cell shape determination protein CcmA, partial [Halobacteria archaeon]|nr:cell shape determination protein CcmA [Halobacteria archaeon]
GTFVLTPFGLLILALTLVGIPLSVIGFFLLFPIGWVALVYGRFVVGNRLLEFIDFENRWLALVLGLTLVSILVKIPFVGIVINLGVFFLGLGGVAKISYDYYKGKENGEGKDEMAVDTPS